MPITRKQRDHPRLRGEYVLTAEPIAVLARITPACAGNTLNLQVADLRYKDHPRLRGEYETYSKKSIADEGSPPLARGIL